MENDITNLLLYLYVINFCMLLSANGIRVDCLHVLTVFSILASYSHLAVVA